MDNYTDTLILTHLIHNNQDKESFDLNCRIQENWLDSGLPVYVDRNQHSGLIQNVRDNWCGQAKLSLDLEIDGEWHGEKIQPISLQVAEFTNIERRWQRFYEHPQWSGKRQFPTWKGETVLEDILGVTGFSSKPDNCTKGKPLTVSLAIFFSEGDIRLFLGDRLARELFDNKSLQRRAYLSLLHPLPLSYWLVRDGVARQINIDIKDYSGYRKSLLETARELNIEMPSKNRLDNYKASMNVAYEQFPEEFIQYAMGDLVLYQIHKARLEKQAMCYQIFELPSKEIISMSPGRQVNDLFKAWIQEKVKVSREVVEHLSLIQGDYLVKDENYLESIIQQASIFNLLDTDSELTTRHLALVHGGRARNESAAKILHRGLVVSADLSGAYSNAMKTMSYPIGLPTIVSFPVNEPKQWLTLDEMLSSYGNELINNLWYAVVDTLEPLSFDQDVLFSKTNVKLALREALTKSNNHSDEDGIQAEFGLVTRELENSIITSSTLELLKNVATVREWAEIRQRVRVKALIFYPKSEKCTNVEEWEQKILKGGKLSTRKNKNHQGNEKHDNRSRAWIEIKLLDFLQPLIDKRKELKLLRNHEAYGSDAYNDLNAQQESVKLIVNTLYGVLCSRYFAINNVVVANNITALVRNVCWCMVKASNGKTAITDGSEALLNHFAFLYYPEGRKAGLNIFTKANDYHALDENTRKYFKLKPLGNKGEWRLINSRTKKNGDIEYALCNNELTAWGNENNWLEINQLYKQHITEFWQSYKLSFLNDFSYEMKDVYQDLVLLNAANYGVRKLSGEIYAKVRGTNLDEAISGYEVHPRLQPYQDILDNQPLYPVPLYQSKQLIKLDGWRTSKKLRKDCLPADTHSQPKYSTLFTASQFTYQTKEDREWWLQHEDRLKKQTGYGLEYYALSEDGTIDINRAGYIQQLIDEGERPYLQRKPLLRPQYNEWQDRMAA